VKAQPGESEARWKLVAGREERPANTRPASEVETLRSGSTESKQVRENERVETSW